MPNWFAIYCLNPAVVARDEGRAMIEGELYSVVEDTGGAPDPITLQSRGLACVLLPEAPDFDHVVWNRHTRSMVPLRPVVTPRQAAIEALERRRVWWPWHWQRAIKELLGLLADWRFARDCRG